MGRRNDDIADDLSSILFEITKRWPAVGIGIGLGLCSLGSYWIWIKPQSLFGLGWLGGVTISFIGIMMVISAVAVIVINPEGKRAARKRLAGAWSIERVRELTWVEFERLVADVFRREGYQVQERGREAGEVGQGDGGVDLVLTSEKSPGAAFLVQCKQYKAWDVGEPKVREFYGAMAAWRTRCEGIIVTCGRFTQPAIDFAADKPIRLIDGDGLLQMLNSFNAIAPIASALAPKAVQGVSVSSGPSVPTANESPVCPKCGAAMMQRTAKRGAKTGGRFWGCSRYPQCRSIIAID